jgi:hypothetical protein
MLLIYFLEVKFVNSQQEKTEQESENSFHPLPSFNLDSTSSPNPSGLLMNDLKTFNSKSTILYQEEYEHSCEPAKSL